MGVNAGTDWSCNRDAAPVLGSLRLERVLGLPEDAFFLLLGLVLAPVLAAAPFLELVGWFFEALVHEMGHSAASWLVGVPAVPALGLTAEALTMHGRQILPLLFLIWGALLYGAYQLKADAVRYTALAFLGTLYPLLCFSALRGAWLLASGHLAELAVGSVFLARALSGGFSQNAVERGLYSILAWFLLGRNILLGAGLASSAAAREHYAANGSYGLSNDLVRLSEQTGTPIELFGLSLALVGAGLVPLVAWRHRRIQRQSSPEATAHPA